MLLGSVWSAPHLTLTWTLGGGNEVSYYTQTHTHTHSRSPREAFVDEEAALITAKGKHGGG